MRARTSGSCPARAARRSAPRCAGPARRSRGGGAAPVRRSHTTTVSRWLVMPIAAIGLAVERGHDLGERARRWRPRSRSASCSTQPGLREVLRELAVRPRRASRPSRRRRACGRRSSRRRSRGRRPSAASRVSGRPRSAAAASLDASAPLRAGGRRSSTERPRQARRE